MAYGVKWRFKCENYRIDVLKDGYSGDIIERPLGANPMLRMDKGDHVRGTSLEFTAECQVESEFLELYTSVATEFKVRLYTAGGGLMWSGFVTPEVYSEPDIAPPYDVSILATDGLGELKYLPFDIGYLDTPVEWTLYELLHHILDQTGEERYINLVSALVDRYGDERSPDEVLGYYTAAPAWLQTEEEASCYEVLEKIMKSFRAFITVGANANWCIVRQTDITAHDLSDGKKGIELYYGDESTVGDYTYQEIPEFGAMWAKRPGSLSMLSHYPVGYLSTTVVPARNGVTLQGDTHFTKNILGSLSFWRWINVTPQTMYGGNFWTIGGNGSMEQNTLVTHNMSGVVLLAKLRISAFNAATSQVRIKLGFYDEEADDWLWWDNTAGTWSSTEQYTELDVTTGRMVRDSDNTSEDAFQELALKFNTFDIGGLGGYLTMEVINPYSTSQLDLYYAGIVMDEDYKGTKKEVTMSNGARENGGRVDMLFCTYPETLSTNYFSGGFSNMLIYGEITDSYGTPVTHFVTTRLPEPAGETQTLLDCLGRDYALEHFYPRLRKNGTLRAHLPYTSTQGWPLFWWSAREEMIYITEEMSWDLVEDEIELTMISMDQTATADI